MYAIIVMTVGLGAGVTACVVRRFFNSCGEECSEYCAVVQGEGVLAPSSWEGIEVERGRFEKQPGV